jgi:Ca2+/Na+ antiporter
MEWYTFLVLCAGIAIVVYGADEAIKRLLNLSKFFKLSTFVTGVVVAGTLAVLPNYPSVYCLLLTEQPR